MARTGHLGHDRRNNNRGARVKRHIVATVATVAAATCAWTPTAAHADPPGTITVTPSGVSARPTEVDVVDWDGGSVVYVLRPQGAEEVSQLAGRVMVLTPPNGLVPLVIPDNGARNGTPSLAG